MRIEITGMTYGANAVGRADDGKVVFVAEAAHRATWSKLNNPRNQRFSRRIY